MQMTATAAKNNFGHMLDACQAGPVFIEKSGRAHSVLMSMQEYQRLKSVSAADTDGDIRRALEPGQALYAKYKAWVDWQNALVDKHGVWSDGLVEWQGDLGALSVGDALMDKAA